MQQDLTDTNLARLNNHALMGADPRTQSEFIRGNKGGALLKENFWWTQTTEPISFIFKFMCWPATDALMPLNIERKASPYNNKSTRYPSRKNQQSWQALGQI